MFHLQSSTSDELVFEDPLFFEQEQSLLADYQAVLEPNSLLLHESTVLEKRQKTGTHNVQINIKGGGSNNESKKMLHRDVERQRRQEMAGLYASLRSLLPYEFIRGKRAVCDHMQEAVKYIKHMQKRIEEIQIRKDKLKKLCKASDIGKLLGADGDGQNSINVSDLTNICVQVNLCQDGLLEILISSSQLNEEITFPLSKVLMELIGKLGQNVVSCVSTRINKTSTLHNIQIQANDDTSIDPSKLQDRLVKIIKFA